MFTASGRVHLISVYAPTLCLSQGTKDSFYEDLGDIIKKISTSEHVILLGDFNARVVSEWSIWPDSREPPRVVNFTVNGAKFVHLQANDSAYLYCEVDGIPTPAAYLNGSSLSKIKEYTSGNNTVNKLLTGITCQDAGRYFCYPINNYENVSARLDNYVDIDITCKPQLVPMPNEPNYANQTREVRIAVGINTFFTVIVYGSDPTSMVLKVETTNGLQDPTVPPIITYTRLTPPFGQINITIPDANNKDSTIYNLNVINAAGTLDVRFNVIKEKPPTTERPIDTTAIAIGVGVGGGVLLIAVVVVVIICVVRKRRQRLKPPARHHAQYINPAFGNNKTNLDIEYIN